MTWKYRNCNAITKTIIGKIKNVILWIMLRFRFSLFPLKQKKNNNWNTHLHTFISHSYTLAVMGYTISYSALDLAVPYSKYRIFCVSIETKFEVFKKYFPSEGPGFNFSYCCMGGPSGHTLWGINHPTAQPSTGAMAAVWNLLGHPVLFSVHNSVHSELCTFCESTTPWKKSSNLCIFSLAILGSIFS